MHVCVCVWNVIYVETKSLIEYTHTHGLEWGISQHHRVAPHTYDVRHCCESYALVLAFVLLALRSPHNTAQTTPLCPGMRCMCQKRKKERKKKAYVRRSDAHMKWFFGKQNAMYGAADAKVFRFVHIGVSGKHFIFAFVASCVWVCASSHIWHIETMLRKRVQTIECHMLARIGEKKC